MNGIPDAEPGAHLLDPPAPGGDLWPGPGGYQKNAVPKCDFCWLIEHGQNPVVYWTGWDDEPWTEDPYRARRFASQRDAEAVLPRWENGRAVEHGFWA